MSEQGEITAFLIQNKCNEPIDDKDLEHREFTYYTNPADR